MPAVRADMCVHVCDMRFGATFTITDMYMLEVAAAMAHARR